MASLYKSTITNEDLEDAAKQYIYLFTEPRELWTPSVNILAELLFESKTLRDTLLIISSSEPQDYFAESAIEFLMEALSTHFGFQFFNIENINFLQKVHSHKSIKGHTAFMQTYNFSDNLCLNI